MANDQQIISFNPIARVGEWVGVMLRVTGGGVQWVSGEIRQIQYVSDGPAKWRERYTVAIDNGCFPSGVRTKVFDRDRLSISQHIINKI